ncbi:MAG: alcohol dehydrogenase catalytic domain-containing protein [Caldilineaceae bacterium]|nr:alcohol dehydrogenase catalytic domain-containing protein [Caldilineaceae bacterium]
MRAVVLTDNGPMLQTARPIPQPAGHEALIRVRLAGICGTDSELIRGYKGGFRGVLGHEFVGEVVAAPAAPEWEGRRVVGEINVGCGTCHLCRNGLAKHCRQRTSLGIIGRDGAFADYTLLPVENLHAVPDGVADEQAVFTEPLAAAFEILEQVHLWPGQRVYLLGDGKLGLLCAFVLAQTGCNLTVIGRHAEKLAIASDQGSHVQTALATGENLERLAAEPAEVVVEATGTQQGFYTALELVRPLGTGVLKSTFANTLKDFDLPALVVDEVTIVGSRCGPFPRALQALAEGSINVAPLLHTEYPLDEALDGLACASRRAVLKVLLRP